MKRVSPIIDAANKYYTNLNLQIPSQDKVWAGLRPCSPDGLPYIGKSPNHDNVIVAGGHAMVGISLATATGYLVKQIVQNEELEIPMEAFRIDR
jgi:D-amino-acid dehydrogenase